MNSDVNIYVIIKRRTMVMGKERMTVCVRREWIVLKDLTEAFERLVKVKGYSLVSDWLAHLASLILVRMYDEWSLGNGLYMQRGLCHLVYDHGCVIFETLLVPNKDPRTPSAGRSSRLVIIRWVLDWKWKNNTEINKYEYHSRDDSIPPLKNKQIK